MNDLMHVGVLGMRWGRRKVKDYSTLGINDLRKKAFETKKVTGQKTKNVNKMTSKELVKFLDSPITKQKMSEVKKKKAIITAGKVAVATALAGPLIIKKVRQVTPYIKDIAVAFNNAKIAKNLVGKVIIDSHFI